MRHRKDTNMNKNTKKIISITLAFLFAIGFTVACVSDVNAMDFNEGKETSSTSSISDASNGIINDKTIHMRGGSQTVDDQQRRYVGKLTSYAERPILSVLGDSISSYYGLSAITPYAPYNVKSNVYYHMDFSDLWWNKVASDMGNEVGDLSVEGTSAFSIDKESNFSFLNDFRTEYLGHSMSPDVIMVYGGINDVDYLTIKNKTRFYNSYKTLINRLHSMYNCRLVLIAPYYRVDKPSGNSLIDYFAEAIAKTAKNNNDYYVDTRGILGKTDYIKNNDVHPNETGMQKIANIVEEAIANSRGKTGIENIRIDEDIDYYIVKVNAYNPNYDNLRFRFRLTDSSTGEVFYYNDWSFDNCYYLNNINSDKTYNAYAEIDNNGDGLPEADKTLVLKGLKPKRTGTTIYNGVDYGAVYSFNYYIENYGDIYANYRNNPEGAIEHFVNYGMNEGRQAVATFDAKSYRNRYQDLRCIFGFNDLPKYYMHYIESGKNEGRDTSFCGTIIDPVHGVFGVDFSSVYDYEYYKSNNQDVYMAIGDDDIALFRHFLENGMNEGRQASENFNIVAYANNNPDLIYAFWINLPEYYYHYINSGKAEGRIAI